jgi:outer membrane murein-binding lipoprotein Lpp
MLSRRTSNLIFYAVILAITLVVAVTRLLIVGAINNKIDDTVISNRTLQARIETLEQAVQEHKDTASDHLYQLYDKVPQEFNQEELGYYTEAQLELIGITDDFDVRRTVNISDEVEISHTSSFSGLEEQFKIVEVYVYFETQDLLVVDDFIDKLYSSEQIFVVSEIEFSNYTSGQNVGVNITFLAFYELETPTE